jgi:RNA polymerase sigma-70 factor (ECF subfamily)
MSKTLSELTDEELIAEFQRDNEAAFAILVSRHKDSLTNFAYRFLNDWDDCNDVVQETFVRVFRKKHSYAPVAKFSTWLYTIATNLAKTQLRKRKLHRLVTFGFRRTDESELFHESQDEYSQADRRAESSIKRNLIERALASLPVKYREVIVLRDIQELSYEEIAVVTRLNIGTVKSRINRARSQLKDMLKDLWND